MFIYILNYCSIKADFHNQLWHNAILNNLFEILIKYFKYFVKQENK